MAQSLLRWPWISLLACSTLLGLNTLPGACSTPTSQVPGAELQASYPKYEYRVEHDVMITMRDGVELAADVYFPNGLDTDLPTVLIRTPYSKMGIAPTYARHFARCGYAAVIQDVRGKFKSGGRFSILANEADDGYDTMAWIVSQPWSNGKIGTFGCSYLGECQVLMAKKPHPSYVAMICQGAGGALGSAGDRYAYGGFFSGGAFALSRAFSWMMANGARNQHAPKHYRPGTEDLTRLPVIDMIRNHRGPATEWESYLEHRLSDQWWHQIGYVADSDSFYLPALHITSWFDYGAAEGLYLFNIMQRNAATEVAANNQFMIVSPMDHCHFEIAKQHTVLGKLPLGDARFNFGTIYLAWFDYWLKGIENGVTEMPRLQIFVMGENQWRAEEEWPLARTEYLPYYLHSRGNACSRYAEATLSTAYPEDEPDDQFTYDPQKPVPSPSPVPADQSEVEMRTDVLVYTSPVLERVLEVTGPIKAILYVSSSAVDTDFTAKLVDVQSDGPALNIQSGILRARYREGFDKEVWMQPGEVYRLELDLRVTSYCFRPGHQIRLEISSSSFPAFDRNPNTGGNNYDETTWKVAVNSIYHSEQYPSHLLLPVIPKER